MANYITTTGVRYDLVPTPPRTSDHDAKQPSTRCSHHALITALGNSGRTRQRATHTTLTPEAAMPQPSIGRIVHYVSHGTPGGEYGKECRAAIITELAHPDEDSSVVGLAVLNPTGVFFNRAPRDDGAETPGSPDCPDQETHGNPFRYCACGWAEAAHKGGTWHWPEQV